MDFLRVFIMAPISITVLFFLCKLIGSKQIANLSMFDYINGITIGSIAAETATCHFDELPECLLALLIYAAIMLAMALAAQKSIVLRRIFTGKNIVLYDRGKIYKRNFSTAKIDLNEFLTMLRSQGYFCLDDIETVTLEQNGQVSILPKDSKRPVTPDDLKIRVHQTRPEIVVILNGKVLERNLKSTGNNKQWLENQLKEQKQQLKSVFAAVCDGNNNLKVLETARNNPTNDMFE